MDQASQIETYKEWLRVKYASDLPGLRRLVTTLGDGSASDATVITSQNFTDGGAAGQLVLEPLVKLAAALAVLRELDPDNAHASRASGRLVDFSCRLVET